jgi:hypothetical protein
VAAPNTPSLSATTDRQLSNHFDSLFGNGTTQQAAFRAGARKAYQLILDNCLTKTDSSYWIHFTNIGDWGGDVLDRSSITEFLQLSNGIGTAAYYHVFDDANGHPLNGADGQVYVLTFPAGQLPKAKLFWSLTAYTPQTIELVANPANKFGVASYLPGLRYNPDGSLSVYMARTPPPGVASANWLPIPASPFNVMLRVYGPEGDVADNRYVPPRILTKP